MIDAFDLKPGARVALAGGGSATILENMEDGMWLEVREDGAGEGELVHVQDIARLLTD